MLRQLRGRRTIEMLDRPMDLRDSLDSLHADERPELLADVDLCTSFHSVVLRADGNVATSVVFGAPGGASSVHQNSLVVLGDTIFVAVGAFVVALDQLDLATKWARAVDDATCFGIHLAEPQRALISHGELEIVRLTLDGDITWRAGGRDIFTDRCEVGIDCVCVRDFEGKDYSFDLATGRERGQ